VLDSTVYLAGATASVDAWIALRVTFVAAKASEVILVERKRGIRKIRRAARRLVSAERRREAEGVETCGSALGAVSHEA
jgi:hypothetical protein